MSNSKYHCPRCGSKVLIDLGENVECPECGEYQKTDLDCLMNGELEASEILTIKEKLKLFKTLEIDPKGDPDSIF